MQRTLSIIKPDGVARGLIGNVIQRNEKLGLKIVAMKMVHLTLGQAQGFYAVHRERPFFQGLTSFMSSGQPVAGGVHGAMPRLDALDAVGNLTVSTDFRTVYAAVIDDFLGGDHSAILPGGPFAKAPVIQV